VTNQIIKKYVLTEKKSTRHLGTVKNHFLQMMTGIKNWSFNRIYTHSHKTKFCQYKITYIHQVKQPDYTARIHFWSCLLQNVSLHSVKVVIWRAVWQFNRFKTIGYVTTLVYVLQDMREERREAISSSVTFLP
jgi:hypothetical protein